MRRHRIQMRENGSSLDFNFISLLNPVVDKNWVCRHCLLQFFLEKLCRVQCSDLFKLFSVHGKFTERYHTFCAWTDLLLTIFVCSSYRLWATDRLPHHFGFVMCVNSRLNCTHFLCHWHKIRIVLHQLAQISKRLCNSWSKTVMNIYRQVLGHHKNYNPDQ